jgi:hypothetical protein
VTYTLLHLLIHGKNITISLLSREILSQITQFRTGDGDIGAYLQKRKVPKVNYNCKCGEFETVQHIVKHCQRTVLKRGPGLSPTVKYTKRAPSYEGIPLVKQTQLTTAYTRWVIMPYSKKRGAQALS